METEPASSATSESRHSIKVPGNSTCKPGEVAGRNAKAQTMVQMRGNKGQTKEVYQKVENMDEVKSRSEPQKKPQVRHELWGPQERRKISVSKSQAAHPDAFIYW